MRRKELLLGRFDEILDPIDNLLAAGTAASLLFATASGCGQASRICTLIGVMVGVTVQVKAPFAAEVDSAVMEVCWDGACHEPESVVVFPAAGEAPAGGFGGHR